MKLAPEVMDEVFAIIECPYPPKNELRFKSRKICTVRYEIETDAFVGARIWSYMTSELKESTSINKFRPKIKTWKPENCLFVTCLFVLFAVFLLFFFCFYFAFLLFFSSFSFKPQFKFDLN